MTVPERIVRVLHDGDLNIPQLVALVNCEPNTIHNALMTLRRAGTVEALAEVERRQRGRPGKRYRLVPSGI